jgi:hypothetical protein
MRHRRSALQGDSACARRRQALSYLHFEMSEAP